MDYIIKDDTIIFSPEYNRQIDTNLLTNCKKIIFSNYELDDYIFDKYNFGNLYELRYVQSKFNYSVNNLPNSLIHLTFGHAFNYIVDKLPEYLTHLIFGWTFNQSVDKLPQYLTYLIFSESFNNSVDNLPEYLTHLTFGWKFNKQVDNLPKTLTFLFFNFNFNHSVDKLPNSLTHLTFGSEFNHSVDNLPSSLYCLTFGWKFNQKIDNLPSNLTYLTIDYNFNKKVNLPHNIKYLNLRCNNQYIIDYLPDGIEELEFGMNFTLELNNLPSTIKKIVFPICCRYNKELNCLPNFVELIQLPRYYDKKILKIPKELKKIICHENYKFIKDFDNVETYFQ